MKKISVIALITLMPGTVWGIPFPYLSSPRITYCEDMYNHGPCSRDVYYKHDGVIMVDVHPVSPPNPSGSKKLIPMGLDCSNGNTLNGDLPFRNCTWLDNQGARPWPVGKCELKDTKSWALTADSTCTVMDSWGASNGAGPGGECVMFTQAGAYYSATILTPWGYVNAEQAANARSPYCAKAVPPNVKCDISLPNTIEHGVVAMGGASRREEYGVINCGGSPKVDVLVNGDTDTGGVKIKTVAHVDNPSQLRIVSEVSVSATTVPGVWSATYVFVASPY